MEKYQELHIRAQQGLQKAEQTMLFTYRMINSPKLLLGVVQQLDEATTSALDALLTHQKEWGKIQRYDDDLKSKLSVLKEKIMKRHSIDAESINTIKELRDIINEHQKSPTEFERKDRLVICTDKYRMKIITANDIRKHIDKAKLFIQQTYNIICTK
jgi:hypothetical protein